MTQECLAAAGLPAYEISNHARPGQECRHNLLYWRYEDYVGVGPGAHGRLTLDGARIATRQERAPETWLSRIAQDGHGTAETEVVPVDEAVAEALLMGLRLTEGIDAVRFEQRTGRTPYAPPYIDMDGTALAQVAAILPMTGSRADNSRVALFQYGGFFMPVMKAGAHAACGASCK